MSQSRRALREAPSSRDRLAVYSDELLERGDPHAELLRASLAGESTGAWLDRHGDALRTSLGEPTQLRLCHGLVHQIDYAVENWLDLPPDALAPHPLAFLLTPSFTKAETRAHAECLRVVLDVSAPFGLALAASNEWAPLKRLAKIIPRLTVEALRLSSAAAPWLGEVELPNLRALWLSELPAEALARPFTEQVSWLSLRSLEHLDQVLDWPGLRLLNLLTMRLDAATTKKLERWRDRGDRTVVHEAFSTRDPHPLADVFGAAGEWWPQSLARTVRAVASMRHDEFVSASGRVLRGYLDGEPAWSRDLPANVKTLRGHADGCELTLRTGEQMSFERDGTERTSVAAEPSPAPRTANNEGLRATISGDDVVITDEATGVERSRWALGPGLEVIVPTTRGFACASRLHLWQLTVGAAPRLLQEVADGRHVVLAANRSWIAVSFSPSSVFQTTEDGARTKSCHWPSTYSRGGGPLAVEAIAVEDSGRAIVGLSDQAVNLLDPESGQAFKPGEHHGQPYRHWVFIYEGSILVSD